MFAFLFFLPLANADTVNAPFISTEVKAQATITPKIATSTLDELFLKYSLKYDIPESLMRRISYCESRYNPLAHNLTSKEDSWGLSQINTKVWNVTVAQATDPDYALDFLGKYIKDGTYTQKWVTCSK